MTTTNDARTRVEEIIWCLGQADQIEKDAEHEASNLRWRAARQICAELEVKTQYVVADEIGKHQSFVARAAQTHRMFGEGGLRSDEVPHQSPLFWTYYRRIEKDGPRLFTDLSRDLASNPQHQSSPPRADGLPGMSNRGIAARLGIDEKTVRGYLRGYLQEEGDANEARAPYDYQAKYRDEDGAGPSCDVLNPYPGTFDAFKSDWRLLVKTRQLREDRASFDEVRRAVDRFTRALDKIEKEFYQ